jgi:threonine/homoserine/homoserine lactone efflux protein
MGAHLVTFIAVAGLLVVTPGADTAMVLGQTVRGGRRGGMLASLGVASALVVHATLSSLGLSAILARSAAAFTVVKLIGAAYLVFLGLRTLWSGRPRRADAAAGTTEPISTDPEPGIAPYRRGVLSNLLNPKVAVFFYAFLPQFIDRGGAVLPQTFVLAAIFIAMGLAWLTILVVAASRAISVLRKPASRRVMERVTGSVLVAFGVRLATAPR